MSKTDKALIFSAISLVIFTISMEVMWYITGSIPEALVVSFFTAFGFEVFARFVSLSLVSECHERSTSH